MAGDAGMGGLKLFHWNRVAALEHYTSGDVIVMAETVDEARTKAIDAAGPVWFRHKRLSDRYFDNIDGDDAEDWRAFAAKLLLDLEAEPIVIDAGAAFIWGS